MTYTNLQDFIDHVTHNTSNVTDLHTKQLSSIANDINGARLQAKIGRASGAATVDAAGNFTGARTGSASGLLDEVQSLKDFRQQLEEMGGEGTFKTALRDQQRGLEKKAQNVYRDVSTALEHHEAVGAEITSQKERIGKLLKDRFNSQAKDIETALKAEMATAGTNTAAQKAAMDKAAKARTQLLDNLKAANESLADHFKDLTKSHADQAIDLRKVVSDIEKETGIKFEEHASKKAVATLEGAGSKAVATGEQAAGKAAGFFGKIGQNFKGNAMSKGKAAIGVAAAAGFGISGAKQVLRGVGVISPQLDENGKAQATDGDIFMGGAKLAAAAGGLWLAGHGAGR
ncbi:MAG: hypothetical protein SFT92_02330 [Rickettsiales bacterium]|nr:hypothetical protein [Rickettsiales bacterium]